MMKIVKTAAVAAAIAFGATAGLTATAQASGDSIGPELKKQEWSFDGIFGRFDNAQLQRGYQVYKEVCANCHAMHLVSFRNLMDIGFTEDQVKEIASEYEVEDGPDDNGDMFMRAAIPADRFPSPFPNEKAAAVANGGAVPPDLSLMAKARVGGPDYIYSLMTGFASDVPGEPAEWWVEYQEEHGHEPHFNESKWFNNYFPGFAISMPPQLMDDLVSYEDGTPATVDQIAKDVTSFLTWAAEPELNARKSMGIKVLAFLAVLTILLYALKKSLWRNVEH